MLISLRRLVCTLLLSGAMLVPGLASAEQLLDRIVAVVNDDVVLASELERELRVVVQRLQQQGVQLPPEQALVGQVLDRLVMERLQLSAAERMGIQVDDATLNAALRRIAEQNQLSLSQFRDVLAQEGMSFAQFREDLREEIRIQRLRQRQVESKVNVTPQEVDELLRSRDGGSAAAEYLLGHVLIALPRTPSPEQLRSARAEAEQAVEQLQQGAPLEQVAAAHSDSSTALEGGSLGWRSAAELPTLFAQQVPQMQPGEVRGPIEAGGGLHIIKLLDQRQGEQNLVTQTRARHILIQPNAVVSDSDARLRLESLRERIQAGESFEQLARQYSADKGSARQGGDLGWVDPGSTVPQFEQTMNSLAPGEISQPFQSQFGWHIVQVLERRQHDNTEQVARAQAANQIRQRKSEEALERWLRGLREEAYVDYRLDEPA